MLRAAGDIMEMDEIVKYIIAICSLYRLTQIARQDYRDQVADNAIVEYQKWLAYTPYTRIMATIDMFLNEFPYHKFAQARLGTIISRFKDCSALLSTKLIMDTLGFQFEDFAPWIWTKRCDDQFLRVIKGGEEMDNTRSYAMYFMEFGMSGKSPYSASVNYDLHLFYHTIGVTSGLTRSKNARFVGTPEVNNVISNGAVIAYVLGTFASFNQQFNAGGVPLEDQEDDQIFDEMVALHDKEATSWLGYILQQVGKVPRFTLTTVLWATQYYGSVIALLPI